MATAGPRRWNQPPVALKQTLGPFITAKTAAMSMSIYTAAAALVFLLPRVSLHILQRFNFLGYKYIIDTTCIAVGVACMLQILNTWAQWSSSTKRSKAQEKLTSAQRSLLGIPPAPQASPAPPKSRLSTATSAIPSTPPPITPPLQRQKPLVAPSTPWSDPWAQPPHTPSSAPPAIGTPVPLTTPATATPISAQRRTTPPSNRTRSPGTRDVCTPEQLNHYLDAFSKETQAAAVAEQQYPVYGTTPYTAYQAAGDAASPAPLPLGRDAPKYHMSWVRKGTSSTSVSDVLQPSTTEEVEEVMEKVLRMSRAELDVWTERLREWLSGKLLKPLVQHIQGAHEELNGLLAQLGEQQIRLPAVQAVVSPSGGDKMQMDVESTVATLEKRCDMAGPQQAAAVQKLRQALLKYRQLIRLLRGEQPPQLLQPPAPSGYLMTRLHALSEGTCMSAFQWNGGGAWGNKPWSVDLPTDGAIVFFLLAAFLEVPGWEWGMQDGSSTTTLFVGQAPSRLPRHHSLILAKRPDKLGKEVAALVALSSLTSSQSLYSIYFDGRVLTLMPSYKSLFHAILMFLQWHKSRRNGVLGLYPMANPALDLARVLEPVRPAALVSVPQRVLGWWFPAPQDT